MHVRIAHHPDRTQSRADRETFRTIIEKKSMIIDPNDLTRRLRVIEIFDRMSKKGPRWGPTREELFSVIPWLPGLIVESELTGTKMEIVNNFGNNVGGGLFPD